MEPCRLTAAMKAYPYAARTRPLTADDAVAS